MPDASQPSPQSQSQAASILLAEDEETDALMFQLAMERGGITYPLFVARDGQEAVDYLSGEPPFGDRSVHPLPSLIILDLKMPRLTGFDVLAWLAKQPELQKIPSVVLSSSSYAKDIQQAAQLGAREYYIKPHSLHELIHILKSATQKWIEDGAK